MFDVEVEESKVGTGGKVRVGGCRGCVGESGAALSAVACPGGFWFRFGLRGRSQSAGGIVGMGKSL